MTSGVHLHSLFEGWCLIRERYFLIRRDVLLAAQEVCDQTSDITGPFLAYRGVAWLAAVVDHLQAPWAGVPRSGCAIDKQIILEINFALSHAVI